MTMARRNLGGVAGTADGGVAWWSYQPAAVAPGSVRVADGVAFTVDGGNPERLVAWTVESPDGFRALVSLLGEGEWSVQADAFLRSTDRTPMTLAMPSVPPPVARLGLVAAVRRWFVRPIDDSLLSVDEALAWHAAGRDHEAARLLSRTAAVLLTYGEDVLDGALPPPVCDLVDSAARIAADLLPPAHPDRSDIHDLAAQLAARAALHAVQIVWENPLPDSSLVTRAAAPTVAASAVDLSLVPPRVLAWRSAREPEIVSAHLVDEDVLEVVVGLADRARPSDGDVRSLTVSLTDNRTGQFWSGAGLLPDDSGHALTARVPLFGRVPDSLVVTIHSPERPPGQRATTVGQDLAMVERLAVESWTWERTAAVLGAAERWQDAEEIAATAESAAESAVDHLEALRDRGVPSRTGPDQLWGSVGVPAAFAWNARMLDAAMISAALSGLREWADRRVPPSGGSGSMSSPLLAEWDSVLGLGTSED